MFQPGDLIDDRYDILGALGQGGMAHVFRAHDRHLEREIALKVLRPHLTETDSQRFRREIQALARLDHPGIVSIFDLGSREHIYFTMELIEGGEFTALGPFELDSEALGTLLEAAITVADALAYVHRLGMVHRDVTPRNILLTPLRQPKVMDFGLVQLTETSRQLTRTGHTLGTPQYMAPEQARGDHTGAPTDLYSFGAVLYRTLTGVAPFDAENDQAVLYKHVYGELTPAVELNPLIPLELSQLVGSLLAKDPDDRPASAAALADALRTLLHSFTRKSTHLPQGGPGRCSFYPAGPVSPRRQRRLWQAHLPEGPQWPAGIGAAHGYVLIGLRSDQAVALRPADGAVVHTFETEDEVSSAPIYSAGRLFIPSRDGGLKAVSWPTGEELWEEPDFALVGLQPYGSSLLMSTSEGHLERIGLDGEVMWSYDAGCPAATAPTVHRGCAAFASQDGWLHVVDAVNGQSRFKVEAGRMAAPPAGQDGLLLIPVRSGELHAFDIAAKETLWSYDELGDIYATPALWNGRAFVASWSSRVRCLMLRTGDDVWEAEVDGRVTASPVIAAGVLWVATENGSLHAFEARTGVELLHEQVSHSAIQASPLPLGDALVVASLDGTVTAYGRPIG